MKQLEDKGDLADALKTSQPYGMLSKTIVQLGADLTTKTISTSLTRLEQLGMIGQVQTAKIERRGRPEKVYLVTQDGVDWLRENGFEEASVLGMSNPIELAHRFCQSLVGACVPMWAKVGIEQIIPLKMGRNFRVDVVFALYNDKAQLMEIEQTLERNNIARAVEKFVKLGEMFSDTYYQQHYRSDVLFIFNLNTAELPKTVNIWCDALEMAFPGDTPMTFTPRYTTFDRLMFDPAFRDMERFPAIERRSHSSKANENGPVSMGGAIPDYRLAPSARKLLDRMNSIPKKSISIPAHDPDQLMGLCEIARMIHSRSMYSDSPAVKYSSFPYESVQALRDFLHLPENILLFESLKEGMAWLEGRRSGLMVYRDAATRLIWDGFLRHFGFGIGLGDDKALHVYVNVPDPGERFSEIRIEALLSRGFDQLIKGEMTARREEYAKALSWMLTALFIYPVDLGLSETLWGFPKRKGGKQGSAKLTQGLVGERGSSSEQHRKVPKRRIPNEELI